MTQIEQNIEAAMINMTMGDRQFGDRAYFTYHEISKGWRYTITPRSWRP